MPINDEQEEDDLWEEYKKTKSPAIRDKFIRQYMPLVKYVAGKLAVGMPNSVEFDDLVGFGQFGLLDAISKYDTSKNVKFKTYAVTRIRGAILMNCDSLTGFHAQYVRNPAKLKMQLLLLNHALEEPLQIQKLLNLLI